MHDLPATMKLVYLISIATVTTAAATAFRLIAGIRDVAGILEKNGLG